MSNNSQPVRKSKTAFTFDIIVWVVFLSFITMLIGSFVSSFRAPVETERALYYKTTETATFKGVYIRNERVVSGTVNGVIAYTNKDGSKLAAGSIIARVYAAADEILAERKIAELEARIKPLSEAGDFAGSDGAQIKRFRDELSEKHLQIMESIGNGDYEAASSYKDAYMDIQSKLGVAKGFAENYSGKISELRAEIGVLESSLKKEPKYITVDESGYFVSSADGYEDILSYDDALNLTKSQILSVIKTPEIYVEKNAVGKIIDDYRWRMAAVLDTEKTRGVSEGAVVDLRINVSGGRAGAASISRNVKAKIIQVREQEDGTSVYIFESDVLNEEFVKRRVVGVEMTLNEYSGVRISQAAVRFDGEQRGVYALNGSEVEFRKIDIIHSDNDYVIVELTEADGYLHVFDNVIVKGKDLYDGKIVET